MAGGNASQFLDEFRRAYVSTTLLNSFNELIDEIEWSNEEPLNEVFKHIPIAEEVYSKHLKAADVKELALKDYEFEVDVEKLRKAFKTLNENEKQFARFLFASPKLIFEVYSKKFADGVFDLGFDVYVKSEMKKLDDACLFGPYSLVDCVCNASIANSILTSIETATDDFWQSLESILCFGKTKGSSSVSSFNQAMNVMQRLAPVWSQLKASSQFINREEEAAAVRVAEDSNVDRVVAAFQGKYNVIPSDYAKATAISTGLVSNFPNFNKLSNERKLQVSNYLLNNRSRFNSILSDSCKIVSDSIARDVDRMGSINFSKFGVRSIESIGYNNNNDRLKNVTAQIKSSFAKVRSGSMMQKANYIMSYFIPMVTKFKSEVMNDYGSSAQHVFERLDNEMQLFGGGIYEDEPAVVEKTVEKIVEVPVEKIVEVEVPMKGGEYIQIQQGPEMKPEQMLEEVRQAQIDFNHKYEALYRELVKTLNQVSFDNVYKTTLNKLYPLCRVFNDIAIKKAKTTVYLSGLYGKRNRNNAYKLCLLESISTLKGGAVTSFSPCVSVLERMVQLLDESQRKADEIHNRFVNAPRSTSVYLIKNTEAVKISCNLNKDDFMAFDEAINRLFIQIKNTSSESTALSSAAELKKYIDEAGKREKIIKDQYALKQQAIEHEAFNIQDAALRSLMIQTQRAYNEQMLKCVLYINNVVETYFTKKRIEEIASKTISEAEIKKIEKAYLLFKQKKAGDKLKHDLKSLQSKLIDNDSIFNIAAQMAKVFNHSHFIDFYETIYRALNIFGDDFDWIQFKRNLMQFICLNSLSIKEAYRFDKLPSSKDELAKTMSLSIFCLITASLISHTDDLINIHDALLIYIEPRLKQDGFYCYNDAHHNRMSPDIANVVSKIPVDYKASDQDAEDVFACVRVEGNAGEYQASRTQIENMKAFLNVMFKGPKKVNNTLGVSINLSDSSDFNNRLIINSIMDSLLLNVVNIVDKYWSIKYNGNLDLPVNVNQMLKGGSPFDADAFHDLTQAKIIPEAVPFYITALNICEHYFTELDKQTNGDTYAQKISVSKIAVIYPIYELFKKYNATLKTLSGQQLTTAVSVLNSIWNRTAGSNDEKLSASIDLLLNELNASIFIDDQLASGLMEGDNTFARSALENINRVLKTITEIYSSSNNGLSGVSPEEARLGYESMMRRAYNKVKSMPDEARLTELRNILAPTEKDDLAMHDYYKFMDFIIAPLMLLNVSYSNIFKLFDIKVYQEKENQENKREELTIDLRDEFINDFIDDEEKIKKVNPALRTVKQLRENLKKEIKVKYNCSDWLADVLMACDSNEIKALMNRYDAECQVDFINDLTNYKQAICEKCGYNINDDYKFDETEYYKLKGDSKISLWSLITEYDKNLAITAMRLNRVDDVIQNWNIALEIRAINQGLQNGISSKCNKWNMFDVSTWPTTPVIKYINTNRYNRSQYIECLKRVYPEVSAHTVADYFDYAIKQFASDLDQIMHLFMVYPGMSDANIQRIESSLHNYVDAKKLLNHSEIVAHRAKLNEIEIKKVTKFVPPTYDMKMIPTFSDGEVVIPFVTEWDEEIDGKENKEIEDEENADEADDNNNMLNPLLNKKEHRDKWVRCWIDGNENYKIISRTGLYLNKGDTNSHVRAMLPSDKAVRGGIADYVIYMLASSSPTWQLPFKLADAFRRDSVLGLITKPVVISPKYAPNYSANKTPNNQMALNINTQNIMARSLILSNQGIEISALPQTTINNMVAIIPYLISYVQNQYRNTVASVDYEGTRIIDECESLINILSKFYNELSANITPISFLQSSPSANSKDHILGETVSLAKKPLSKISNFSVLEWANRFKFALSNITYPDFKNKDKYEFIHNFGENMFTHPIFRQNFNVIIENMGRQLWNSILAVGCTGTNIDIRDFYYSIGNIEYELLEGLYTKIIDETINKVLSYIIGRNTDTLVDVSLNKVDNYGFMIPMTGGDELYPMLINEAEPSTPMRTMRALYKDTGIPYRMYRTLFNGAFSFYNDEPANFFNVAMNYFHKFNIRMSSIFNNLCFVQLLTNSVVLNNACKSIGEAIDRLPDKNDDNSKYMIIKNYLKNACSTDIPVWNNEHMSIVQIADEYRANQNLGLQDDYPVGPTSNRTFRKELMNATIDNSFYSMFLYSDAFSSMTRLEEQITYLNMLVRFMHRTSYYDVDSDTNESLFNIELDNPF